MPWKPWKSGLSGAASVHFDNLIRHLRRHMLVVPGRTGTFSTLDVDLSSAGFPSRPLGTDPAPLLPLTLVSSVPYAHDAVSSRALRYLPWNFLVNLPRSVLLERPLTEPDESSGQTGFHLMSHVDETGSGVSCAASRQTHEVVWTHAGPPCRLGSKVLGNGSVEAAELLVSTSPLLSLNMCTRLAAEVDGSSQGQLIVPIGTCKVERHSVRSAGYAVDRGGFAGLQETE